MTQKKAFDCTKADLADLRTPSYSGPVTRAPAGPKWLEGLKTALTTVAIIALLLGLLSPACHAFWIGTIVLGLAAFLIHLVQQHLKHS